MGNCLVTQLKSVVNNDSLDYFGGATFAPVSGSAQLLMVFHGMAGTTTICKIVKGVPQSTDALTISGSYKGILLSLGDKLYVPYKNIDYIRVEGDGVANVIDYIYDLNSLIPFLNLTGLALPTNNKNNINITYKGDSYEFVLGQIKLGRTTCEGIAGGRFWNMFTFGGNLVSVFNASFLKWDTQKVYLMDGDGETVLYEKEIELNP